MVPLLGAGQDYKGASGYGSVGVYRRDLQKKKLLNRTARITPAGREILVGLQGVEKVEEVEVEKDA